MTPAAAGNGVTGDSPAPEAATAGSAPESASPDPE